MTLVHTAVCSMNKLCKFVTAVTPAHCVAVWQLFLLTHNMLAQGSLAQLSLVLTLFTPFIFLLFDVWKKTQKSYCAVGLAMGRPSLLLLWRTLKLLHWGNFRFPIICTLHTQPFLDCLWRGFLMLMSMTFWQKVDFVISNAHNYSGELVYTC